MSIKDILGVTTIFSFLKFFKIYFGLHCVCVAERGHSLVAEGGGYSLFACSGFSLQWFLLLQSMGSRLQGLP